MTRRRPTPDLQIGLLVFAIAALMHTLFVLSAGGDPTVFAALGEDDVETTPHVVDVLGRDDVVMRASLGHDGKFFLVQAWDPLYIDRDHAPFLDRPVYRAQRMLFPFIAGLGGLAPDAFVPWLMAATNVVALGLGAVGTARLAMHHGKSHKWGLAFLLNLGVFSEVSIGGAGIVAFALLIWGVLALENDRIARAGALFLLSSLAREVMLAAIAGVALHRMVRDRRLPVLLAAPSVLGVAAWGLYIRLRLDAGTGVDEVRELGPPFLGMIRAARLWPDEAPLEWVMTGLVLVALGWAALRVFTDRSPLMWSTIGFLALAPLLTAFVWLHPFDIARATLPVFTALAVSLAPRTGQPSPPVPSERLTEPVDRRRTSRRRRVVTHVG